MDDLNITEQILAADEARYQALYAQDVEALEQMLHQDYVHIHANGKIDKKGGFLTSIGAAKYRFVRAERTEHLVRHASGAILLSGKTATTIDISGEKKTMKNAFLTVWTPDADGWKLLHWQATKLPEV